MPPTAQRRAAQPRAEPRRAPPRCRCLVARRLPPWGRLDAHYKVPRPLKNIKCGICAAKATEARCEYKRPQTRSATLTALAAESSARARASRAAESEDRALREAALATVWRRDAEAWSMGFSFLASMAKLSLQSPEFRTQCGYPMGKWVLDSRALDSLQVERGWEWRRRYDVLIAYKVGHARITVPEAVSLDGDALWDWVLAQRRLPKDERWADRDARSTRRAALGTT
ncbi:hypothetical protein M885DRAFT_556261 [Pelagophyceae sp. CCMP2097]|nr:hypothetical protein M885DRAFT_556261 [Pelagophyceae sp. CCMP2097]